MSKHTPGPWQIKKWMSGHFDTLHIQACNEKAEWIARIEFRHLESETQANAQLIAAAPELLEAITALWRAMQPFNDPNGKLLKSIAELIVKAGGQP